MGGGIPTVMGIAPPGETFLKARRLPPVALLAAVNTLAEEVCHPCSLLLTLHAVIGTSQPVLQAVTDFGLGHWL